MEINQVRVNTPQGIVTNTYIVVENGEIMVIDPGGEPKKILDRLDEIDLPIKYIVLTHCHSDHLGALLPVQKERGGKVVVSIGDEKGVSNPLRHLGPFVGQKVDKIKVDITVKENDTLDVGNTIFKVIETPGHTKGGISIYSKENNVLFSGDTLFKDAYGRTDLPTGSFKAIKKSIKKLMILPDETKVYPGHGKPTSIGDEREIYNNWRED